MNTIVPQREVVKLGRYRDVVVIDYFGDLDASAVERVRTLARDLEEALIASSMNARLVQIGPAANVDRGNGLSRWQPREVDSW